MTKISDGFLRFLTLDMVKDLPGYRIVDRRVIRFHSLKDEQVKWVTSKEAASLLGWDYPRLWKAIKDGRVQSPTKQERVKDGGGSRMVYMLALPIEIDTRRESSPRHFMKGVRDEEKTE